MKFLSIRIIILFISCVVVYSCTKDGADNAAAATSTGKGGSLAKFTIVGNYFYSVDAHYLYTYDITNPVNPVKTNQSAINFDIETIYPFNNRLFIGTRTGMYIYSIDTPSMPSKIAEARHARSCDPVVANDSIAFVTLKGNTNCGPATSGLYVHDIKNIFQPTLIKTVAINSPEGLGLQGNVLYICCNNEGLKVYNVSNPSNPVEKATLTGKYFRDVIPYNNLLICYVSDGITLYDLSKPETPVLIQHITN
jgi:hypothetical protein